MATTSGGSSSYLNASQSPMLPAAKGQAAFVHKLFAMVDDESIQYLISWAPGGDVFSVFNPTDFSRIVLPQYFKHNNWQSFVRQLNMYGFHKVRDAWKSDGGEEEESGVEVQAWDFQHPFFQKSRPDLLSSIKRKPTKSSSSNLIGYPTSNVHSAAPSRSDPPPYARPSNMLEGSRARPLSTERRESSMRSGPNFEVSSLTSSSPETEPEPSPEPMAGQNAWPTAFRGGPGTLAHIQAQGKRAHRELVRTEGDWSEEVANPNSDMSNPLDLSNHLFSIDSTLRHLNETSSYHHEDCLEFRRTTSEVIAKLLRVVDHLADRLIGESDDDRGCEAHLEEARSAYFRLRAKSSTSRSSETWLSPAYQTYPPVQTHWSPTDQCGRDWQDEPVAVGDADGGEGRAAGESVPEIAPASHIHAPTKRHVGSNSVGGGSRRGKRLKM